VPAVGESKSSPLTRRSAVRSGVVTSFSYVVLSIAGALAGVYLAHKFGRNTDTDGFLAAYGVYLVLVFGAQAFRMVVVPDLTRAEAEGRLAPEFTAYAIAFLLLGVPATILVAAFPHFFGELVTGRLPARATEIAGSALVWIVPAAFAQLLAALAASALAARDSYASAAAGFALGGLTSLVVFVLAADQHGLIALAWGLAANGAIALAIPLIALIVRGGRLRHLTGGAGTFAVRKRLWRLTTGASVPIAVQVLYLMALRFAGATGEGNVTSLSYAYLLAATFVTATAFSLSLISAAPLTRRGLDPDTAAEHVVHSGWVSLALVGAGAGIVAIIGGPVVGAVLGHAFSGKVGDQLGQLVVYLSPWMVGSAAFSITYPLLFVTHRTRLLLPIAAAVIVIDVPISIAARAWAGLNGVAVALGISTLLLVFALMYALAPRMLGLSVVGLGRLAVIVGAATALAFGGASLLLGAVPAAVLGACVYALLLVAVRQFGLSDAWHYVRALH
jgi:hypothetical protein